MIGDIENPFVDYGTIVSGNRFIGRKDDLKVVENRIIRQKESGNLAIIGEPRIGKSSLINKAIIERKDELNAQNIIPIRINLGIYEQVPTFFCSLVTNCIDELKKINRITDIIQTLGDRVLTGQQSWNEKYNDIQRFFEKIRQDGYRVVIILDEFDHARRIFRGDISSFQKLRELSYQPDWRVTFITISRRSIREIELQTQAISTFDGIFHKHYLGMFTDKDVQEYFKKFSALNLTLTRENEKKISFYCGGHPYLLEMLGYEIVENFKEDKQVEIDKVAHLIERSLIDYYDHIIELLQEDKSFNKLLQILFGPIVDARQSDIDKFLKYGIIKPTPQGIYIGFSEHFHIFLNLMQREVDLWPIWSQTEKTLRTLITTKMTEQYGAYWSKQLEKKRPNLKSMFEACRIRQKNEEQSFGPRASPNLIDFTYPNDLFAIISTEWNIFEPIFCKDKAYWNQRAQFLAKIRTPVAHNRIDILEDHEQQIAEGYCKEILSILKK